MLLLSGCGGKGLESRVVRGTVTYQGEKVETGQIRFVPIEGTPGSVNAAPIVDGQYEITARGGVPVGKHRVEVDAQKKTGRKVEKYDGFEKAMVDETVPVGPKKYAGEQSTIVEEVTAKTDVIDIEIPAE